MSSWKFRVNGAYLEVEVEESVAGYYYVKVNGKEHKVVVDEADWGLAITPVGSVFPAYAGMEVGPASYPRPARATKAAPGSSRPTKPALPPQSAAAAARVPQIAPPPPVMLSGKSIPSPMPGRIIRVLVKVGEQVKAGQGICVLESMKMENTIPAPKDGLISALHVKVGDSANTGGPLADIE
jgi:biotin carboxyl carrier protein